ncbi:S-layer homology domain-containing protein, partial [Bifidobacterium boum]|uniref:S-layer homology domain-containing protein n=1 Tax=Bifidobacterium boum TaxID=78343 RepID=UPI001F2ECB80
MDSVKRQDMAAFLRREAKRLGVKDAASWRPSDEDWKQFRDVSSSTPHAEDVLWLAHANVSTGWPEPDGSRTFRGMDPVRRQDMAAFLRREATLMGVPDAASWKPSDKDWKRFRDVTRDTPHAEDVLWLAHANVSTGYADGTFGGMLPVYRQDMAAFLHRLDNLKK